MVSTGGKRATYIAELCLAAYWDAKVFEKKLRSAKQKVPPRTVRIRDRILLKVTTWTCQIALKNKWDPRGSV